MKRIIFFLLLLPLFCLNILAQQGTVVISEVFYDTPYNEDTGLKKDIYNTQGVSENVEQHHNGEFIEFYNPTNQAVDMSEWRVETSSGTSTKILHRGHYSYKFPAGTIINPQGILVLAYRHVNTPNFTLNQLFPEIQQAANKQILYHGGEFYLSNRGHIVTLYNKANQTIDFVSYRGEGRDNNFWQLQAANGRYYGQPNTIKWKSIQRYQILQHPDSYMIRTEDNFTTNVATPLELSANANMPDVSDWGKVSDPVGTINGVFDVSPVGVATGTGLGTIDVSPTGAAVYEFPIIVPPGSANMTPQLSIVYNSQAGIGLCGRQWNLSGISAISRTGKTEYHDGAFSPIQLNDQDALSLDGVRLIKTGDYYETEAESYSKTVFTSDLNGGYFTVYAKDGSIAEYGKGGSDNKQYAGTTPVVWFISRITDANGNSIVFNYSKGYLTYIEYARDLASLLSNRIEFNYKTIDSDLFTSYLKGYEIKRNKICSSIITKCDNEIIKEYQLAYNTTFQLTSIKESIGSGNEKEVFTTEIKWGNNADFYFSSGFLPHYRLDIKGDFRGDGSQGELQLISFEDYPEPSWWKLTNGLIVRLWSGNQFLLNGTFLLGRTLIADFNQDGKDDVVFVEVVAGAIKYYRYHLYLSTGTNLVFAKSYSTTSSSNTTNNTGTINNIGTFLLSTHKNDNPDHIGYFDSPDKPAIVIIEKVSEDNNNSIVYNKSYNVIVSVIDYNPSSNTFSNTFSAVLPSSSPYLNTPPRTFLADVDGDGLTELICENRIYKKESSNKPFNVSGFASKYICPMMTGDTFFADFNGDGKADMLTAAMLSNEYFLYYATGTGFKDSGQKITTEKVDLNKYNITAYQNIKTSKEPVPLCYNCYNDVIDSFDVAKGNGGFSSVMVNDFNGDGIADVMQIIQVNKPENAYFDDINTYKNFLLTDTYGRYILGNNSYMLGFPSSYTDVFGHNQTCATLCDSYSCYCLFQEKKGYSYTIRNNVGLINLLNAPITYTKVILHVTGGEKMEKVITTPFDITSISDDYIEAETAKLYLPRHKTSVISITSGTGGQQQSIGITYKSFYTKGSGAVYPVMDFAGDMNIVNTLETPDGLGKQNRITYNYEGAKVHLKGKGFLGFEKITADNQTQGVQTINQFAFNLTYYNPTLAKTVKQTVSGEKLSEMDYTYTYRALGNQRYALDVEGKDERDYLAGTSKITSYQTDNDGNIVNIHTTTGDGIVSDIAHQYIASQNSWQPKNKIFHTTIESTYPNQPAYSQTTDYRYDARGNLIWQSDGSSTISYTVNSAGLATAVTTKAGDNAPLTQGLEYDRRNRFVVRTIDPLGRSVKKIYRSCNGAVVSETDEQLKLTTQYRYDVLGRLRSVISPLGQTATVSYQKPPADAPAEAVYCVLTESEGKPYTRAYFDQMNREVRTEQQTFGGVVYSDKQYNNKGEVIKASLPYFANETPGWTTYLFDAYGRPQSASANGHNITYTYDKLTTSVTTDGQTKTQTVNMAGNVLSSSDTGGPEISFTYNSMGKPISTGAVTMTYDGRGNQLTLKDPNAGETSYAYNTAGQLTQQTDARGKVSEIKYDNFGRIQQKINEENTITYVYNPLGLLESETGTNGYQKSYEYDKYGRLWKENTVVNGTTYTYRYDYDEEGKLVKKTYPSSYALLYGYQLNQLVSIRQASDNKLIWELTAENSRGQAKQFKWGNGIVTDYSYDPDDGLLTSQKTGTVQHLGYGYDEHFNMTHRSDIRTGQYEGFGYDDLNRLTHFGDKEIHYSDYGNIDYKTGVGVYQYDGAQPHAVTGVTALEGEIPLRKQEITYNSFGKIATVSEDGKDVSISYGVDNQRIEGTWYKDGNPTQTKIYLGDYEIVIPDEDDTKEIHYIAAPTGLVAVMIRQNDTDKLYYACTDHLGSLTALVNEAGQVVERHSYDAWGRERNPDDWEEYVEPNNGGLLAYGYGYTGHEMLPEFGLINMNGRVYDPVLGRMLSPDNYIQDPFNPQNYNRFGYCWNNPLKYTDPTGDNVIGWIIGGAILLFKSYHDGVKANGGQLNPLKWNWSNATFTIGFSTSVSGGGNTVYGGISWGGQPAVLVGYNSGGSFAFGHNAFGEAVFETPWKQYSMVDITISMPVEPMLSDINWGKYTLDEIFDLTQGAYVGNLAAIGKLMAKGITKIKGTYAGKFEGVFVFESSLIVDAAFTAPPIGILTSPGLINDTDLMRHEFGHWLQYREHGFAAYYDVFAPGSLESFYSNGFGMGHTNYWVETYANYLSYYYFAWKHQALGMSFDWNDKWFPIQPLSPENIMLLELYK